MVLGQNARTQLVMYFEPQWTGDRQDTGGFNFLGQCLPG